MMMKWTNSIASRVKMRDLQILLAVAGARGIGKAAAELAISQPAISKTIADLELEFGVPLFDRTPSGVQITPYGEVLLESARAIFDNLRQGVTAIDFLADPTAGHVRIGTTPPLAAGFVPALIGQLSAKYPRFGYQLLQADLGILHRALRERTIDLAIAPNTGVSPREDLDLAILLHDWHVPVAGVHSKWAKRRKVTWPEIIGEPWVLPPSDIALWPYLVQAFHESGLEPPTPTVATVSIPAHLRLLATGRFLTMLPISTLRFGGKHLSIKGLPLESPVKPRPIFLVTLKNRTLNPPAKIFASAARAFAAQSKHN